MPAKPKRIPKSHERFVCPECGQVRIMIPPGSRFAFAVCPSGHGKLHRRFTRAEMEEALLPEAKLAYNGGPRRYRIVGRKGEYVVLDRRRGYYGQKVEKNEVVGRLKLPSGRWTVRVFRKLQAGSERARK